MPVLAALAAVSASIGGALGVSPSAISSTLACVGGVGRGVDWGAMPTLPQPDTTVDPTTRPACVEPAIATREWDGGGQAAGARGVGGWMGWRIGRARSRAPPPRRRLPSPSPLSSIIIVGLAALALPSTAAYLSGGERR